MCLWLQGIWIVWPEETKFDMSKVACSLCVCFCSVLSHVHLLLIRQFAGVVALLAGKRFLTGV